MKNKARTPQRRKTVVPHVSKSRDIGRSVLPSTARRAASADLKAVRRQDRRANAAAARIALAPCVCEDTSSCPRCDPSVPYPRSEHLAAVRVRRDRDKLGPLLRWGAAQVARGGDGGASGVRRALPPGVIGFHALTHLAAAGVVDDPRWPNARYWSATNLRRPVPLATQLADLARFTIENGRVKELNRLLARTALLTPLLSGDRRWGETIAAHCAGRHDGAWNVRHLYADRFTVFRPLRGIHDVEAWSADIAAHDGRRRDVDTVTAWAAAAGWQNKFEPPSTATTHRGDQRQLR